MAITGVVVSAGALLADQHAASDLINLIPSSDRQRRSFSNHCAVVEHPFDVGTQLMVLPGVFPMHLDRLPQVSRIIRRNDAVTTRQIPVWSYRLSENAPFTLIIRTTAAMAFAQNRR